MLAPKKAAIAVGIVLINAFLFLKYTWTVDPDGGGFAKEENSPVIALRHVQKSGGETHPSGAADQEMHEDKRTPLIIYNRVPKTGSTTFANIAYKLTRRNSFNMLHINVTYKNLHFLNILDQERFVRNISTWKEKHRAIYHGHLHYLDFTRFGYKNPMYINIIRDPIERLVSYYYFLRYGDDYRPYLKRASAKDTKTLDECLKVKDKDCNLEKVLWLQIPFFCGQAAQCTVPSRWALEQAKTNLINHYLLVGVTEQLGEFIALLETMLPQYFSGAYDLYTKGGLGHLRKTNKKEAPSEESLAIIRKSQIYQWEQEFYTFALEQFNFLKGRALQIDEDGRAIISRSEFKFEKIFPER